MEIVKNFKASSYSGEYDLQSGTFRITGTISASPDRKLTDISGQILESGEMVGTFSSWRQNEEMHTTVNDIDISRAGQIGQLIASTITAIENDIEEEDE